jgi:hypothetical protein
VPIAPSPGSPGAASASGFRSAPPIVQRVVFALAEETGLEIEVEDDAVSLMVG